MLLFPVLQLMDNSIEPKRCKIHLAKWNGFDDPLDLFFAGEYDQWQTGQRARNFERDMVVSLIQMPESNRWLFTGVFDSHGCTRGVREDIFVYDLRRRPEVEPVSGRLIVEFKRPGRQSYLNCERWQGDLHVAELRAEPLQVPDFPGYTRMMLTKAQLDTIVKRRHATWRMALSSVAGVYVIADRETGSFYVGSATGEDGIWGRWCAYAKNGPGGNRELRELLRETGAQYAANLQYGILETADTSATNDEILARESHWKDLLLSRSHGLNAN